MQTWTKKEAAKFNHIRSTCMRGKKTAAQRKRCVLHAFFAVERATKHRRKRS